MVIVSRSSQVALLVVANGVFCVRTIARGLCRKGAGVSVLVPD